MPVEVSSSSDDDKKTPEPIEEFRKIRREQDEAFEESLRIDKLKV